MAVDRIEREAKFAHLKHPIQPLALDEQDVLRFKSNAIVNWLVDRDTKRNTVPGTSNSSGGMNAIAREDFSQNDLVQFAQLIGYSLSGFGTLSYVADADYDAAETAYRESNNEEVVALRARVASLESRLEEIKGKFQAFADDINLLDF